MDASRLDQIVRAWTERGSRRPLLSLVTGSLAGMASLASADAKKKKKK